MLPSLYIAESISKLYTSANSFLKKNSSRLSFFGGGAENRTPVHTKPSSKHYKLSRCFSFSISKPIDRPLKYLAGSIFFLRIPATPQEAFL